MQQHSKPSGRQATGRATLAPEERTKHGKVYWVARGQIPIREADGTVRSRRIERSIDADCDTEAKRQKRCAELNLEAEERFKNPRKMLTFARAYTNYLGKGHEVPLKGEQILKLIGTEQCSAIDDSIMDELTDELWPDGAMAGTINRHLYTPVISILHMALKEKAPELQRPKGHKDIRPVVIPPEDWYRAIAPECNPSQLAFVMLLAMHGRRTNEMLGRKPDHLDIKAGLLDLGKTKTGVRQLEIHPKCLPLLAAIPNWGRRKWLFGAGPNSANSFRRDLKAACERAGQPWYRPHSFGRHMSVTRMLRAGYSVAHVADAHGMTAEMVTKRYGHLTKKETTAALHAVGGELFDRTFNGGNVGDRVVGSDGRLNGTRLIAHDNPAMSGAPELLPSEGDALSICATGADENPSNYGLSSSLGEGAQPSITREQTGNAGGNVGDK